MCVRVCVCVIQNIVNKKEFNRTKTDVSNRRFYRDYRTKCYVGMIVVKAIVINTHHIYCVDRVDKKGRVN